MKRLILLCACLLAGFAQAQSHTSLDASNPILFDGASIVYRGERIVLGERAIFLDGRLSDAQTGDYVFNTIRGALDALKDGTAEQPMRLYIAPWVYWVDDPDDPTIRTGVHDPARGRSTPFGAVIECEWLHFVGLTDDPRNVVLACNRGQTHGAEGNFTMFNIRGDGLMADNITFGNYCNIDLEFPLDPSLNRARRAEAIVQAQLVFSNADKAVARNCRFVSRLNLCPMTGARRLLFVDCHFETTDDALAGTGVYLRCDFDIYGPKPFGSVADDGPVFLDCDIRVYQSGVQFFTKRDNPVTLIDSRIVSERDPAINVGWSGAPYAQNLCYQYNNTLNGRPLDIIQLDKTIDLSGKRQLGAFRVEHAGEVVYNTYNLLRGDDDWDPMGVKEQILAAGEQYADMPVFLRIEPRTTQMHTGDEPLRFTATAYRHGLYQMATPALTWSAGEGVELAADGAQCILRATHDGIDPIDARLLAITPDGLAGASSLRVVASLLPAPRLLGAKIEWNSYGYADLIYELDSDEYGDRSIITWYRCTDGEGSDPIPVAVSHRGSVRTYTPTGGDVGHYLMALIEPRSMRSQAGPAVKVMTDKPVGKDRITLDLSKFPTDNQPRILPGTWTLGGHKPADTDNYSWQPTADRPNWAYRKGVDGAADAWGLTQIAQGARMVYTPVDGEYGDMRVKLQVAPAKQAGQGFGSATGQYMDIFIKYDTRTMSGYGLRIERTPRVGEACEFTLMSYSNDVATPLTTPVASDAFRAECRIEIRVQGDRLAADVTTTAPARPEREGIAREVHLETKIAPNDLGGMGVQHTGTANANATWITNISIDWGE